MYALTANVDRLTSMVIIDFGTGIRVAAPTSVLAAMTHAARQGILVKGGAHLEKLSRVDTVVFDKTGTLTRGEPRVFDLLAYEERSFPKSELLALAAAAEARLRHPVAEAIVERAKEQQLEIPRRKRSRFQIGLGVEAQVNGYAVHVGSPRYFHQKNITSNRATTDCRRLNKNGFSTLLIAVDGKMVGLLSYADEIRPEAREVIRTLRKRGIKRLIMLTGDNQTVASQVAQRLGIDRSHSETMPTDKAEIVRQLQQDGHSVAMVGDGINDSPALSYADVGIAMKNGEDVAHEAADVILMEENLWKLIQALDISHEAMGLIRQNYAIIAGLNTLALALAIPSGLVTPAITAVISNGSAILATLNAVRPILRY